MAKNSTISLPKSLIKQAGDRLAERGLTLETYVGMQLRTMLRAKTLLYLSDTMPFGKYVGEKVEDVIRAAPDYMTWLLAQSGKTQFAPECFELLDSLVEVK